MKTLFRDRLNTSPATRRRLFWFGCLPARLFLVGVIAGAGTQAPTPTASIILVLAVLAVGVNLARYLEKPRTVWWDARIEIFMTTVMVVLALGTLGRGWPAWLLCLPMLTSVMIAGATAWLLTPWATQSRPLLLPRVTIVPSDQTEAATLTAHSIDDEEEEEEQDDHEA
jgi:hypothetical protein